MKTLSPRTNIRPMLAKDGDLAQLHGAVIVQPKLDGIRAIWDKNTRYLHTRSGRVITSCDHIVAEILALGLQDHNLDGELYRRDLSFQVINGLARQKQTSAETQQLEFHVFDIIDARPAHQRAKAVVSLPSSNLVKPVATFLTTQYSLEDHYQCFLDSDLEGMIVRDPMATYQSGKSNALVRIKPVQDTEATLIGFEPSKTELNRDSFGSLVLQLPNGKTFRCSGISNPQRKKLWQQQPLGASITVLFKGLTNNGIPREPRFKAIRHDLAGGAA